MIMGGPAGWPILRCILDWEYASAAAISEMSFIAHSARPLFIWLLLCANLPAQVAISGRVVDENGAGISGARVELRLPASATPYVASSDPAGNFNLTLPEAGEYIVHAERLGFFLYQGRGQQLESAC